MIFVIVIAIPSRLFFDNIDHSRISSLVETFVCFIGSKEVHVNIFWASRGLHSEEELYIESLSTHC